MTDANEMQRELLQRLDVMTNYSTPGLTDLEVGSILTEAEFQFVEKRLPFVDINEKVRRQLKPLYTPVVLTRTSVSGDQSTVHSSGEYWDIPTDIFHILSEEAVIASSVTCLNGISIPIKPIMYDEYNSNIKNPFTNPGVEFIWKLESLDNTVELIKFANVTEISNYRLTYIKRPSGIIPYDAGTGDGTTAALINTVLPEITHEEIVNIGVTRALKYLGLFPELQADLQVD